MEYDSPLFIAAVKKILRTGIERLSASFNDLKNSVEAHWQADEKRYQTKPVSVSDLRTDIPLQVQTEPKRSKPENAWRYVIGALEALAFIAIIIYTIVANNQWHELIKANNISMSNYRRVRIDANEQQKLGNGELLIAAQGFHADQRAWLMTTFKPEDTATLDEGRLQEALTIENTGKTPASKMLGVIFLRLFKPDQSPDFAAVEEEIKVFEEGTYKPPKHPKGREMMLHGGSIFPHLPRRLPIRGNEVTQTEFAQYPRSAYIAMYGGLVYYDVFNHRHWTHFCTFECNNPATSIDDKRRECANYNGVDGDIE